MKSNQRDYLRGVVSSPSGGQINETAFKPERLPINDRARKRIRYSGEYRWIFYLLCMRAYRTFLNIVQMLG